MQRGKQRKQVIGGREEWGRCQIKGRKRGERWRTLKREIERERAIMIEIESETERGKEGLRQGGSQENRAEGSGPEDLRARQVVLWSPGYLTKGAKPLLTPYLNLYDEN